ncbi:MAG TPA: ABC transporter ATP-binding protein [Actinocrinis sp.]|nr:ABC transporter ATP-binding protein [Actinocrinis sp.]
MITTTGTEAPLGPAGLSTDLVLRASNVSVEYAGSRPTRAVRDVSLELRRGEVLGIVGESGCGKSTFAYALTRMLRPPAQMTAGVVEYFDRDGETVDLATLAGDRLREFRWNKIAMVFQSAMNALNPVTSVGSQMDDIFRTHRPSMDKAARRARSGELLEMVGIDPRRLRSFPHELSGGMRQRVVIAMALALEPEIVVMDEPTTALDVLVQREILDEIERLRAELGFSVIFITHDLALLLEISDRLAVMYAGQVIEYAPAEQVATSPLHPYTRGLLRSFPDLRGERREMHGIPGSPPDLRTQLIGCPFTARCESAFDPCAEITPPLQAPPGAWPVSCHLHDPRFADNQSTDTDPEAGR